MLDEQEFDAAVGGFYRAATGAIAWDEALAPVHAAFGTRLAVMQSVDLETGRLVQLSHSVPPSRALVLDYVREWHALDPRRGHLLAHPEQMIDRWWHCHEHLDDARVAQDPFHRDFLTAHDSRYLSTTATLVTPTLLTSFGVELPAARGPLTADERHLVERLGRHAADALRAHERVRRLAAQALAGHGLLDAFGYPMWLLDPERFVLHANAAAREANAVVADLAEVRAGRLMLRADKADRLFGTHLHALGQGRHGTRASIDTRPRRLDAPCWLHLQALEPQRVLGAFGDRLLVLATLFDPRQMRGLDPFALTELFGMTPTQARVAVLLAEGLTAKAIALRLGSEVSTVRTHLRAVLAKLGVARATDAVRVLKQGESLWARPSSSPS